MILIFTFQEIFLFDAEDFVLPPSFTEQQLIGILNVFKNRASDAKCIDFCDIEGPERNVVYWVMQEPVVVLVLVVGKVTRKEGLALRAFREVKYLQIAGRDVENSRRRYRQLKHVDVFCVEEPNLHVSFFDFFVWVETVVDKAVPKMRLLPSRCVLVPGYLIDLNLKV